MSHLKKSLCLLAAIVTLAMFCNTAVAGGRCPRCHGAGKVKTQYSISSYGVSTERMKCPNCGKMILKNETHYDTCPSCGGTGSSGGGSSSSRSSSSASSADGSDFLASLPPEEAMRFQELSKQLFTGRQVPIICTTCEGSGLCKQCGGYHNMDLDAAAYQMCAVCGGDGFCIGCRGKGNLGMKYESLPEDEKDAIISEMRRIIHKAYPNLNPEDVIDQSGQVVSNPSANASASPMPTNTNQEATPNQEGDMFNALKILLIVGIVGFLVIIVLLAFLLFKRK